VESAILEIGLQLDGFHALKGVRENLSKITESANIGSKALDKFSLSTKLKDISQNLKAQKEALIGDIGNIVGSLGRSVAVGVPVKLAIDYESAMADVKKVVEFADSADLKKFSEGLLDLTTTIPLSSKELAAIAASGGQLGIAKENLLEYTALASKMAVAFDVTAEEAGDSMGKLMNIFQTDIAGVKSLGDAINHLSNNSASKAREIVEVLKRIGGTAKTLKLTETQAAALASTFISLGKAPELAATASEAFLRSLGNATKLTPNAKKAFEELGMSAGYIQDAMSSDPQKMMVKFLGAVKQIPQKNQLGVLTDIFGTGFAGDIAMLANSVETYNKALNNVSSKSKFDGSMQNEFEARSKTTANSLSILKNGIERIGISFGSVFLPPISKAASALAGVSTRVSEWIGKHETLAKVVGLVCSALILIQPAALVARLAFIYTASTATTLVGALNFVWTNVVKNTAVATFGAVRWVAYATASKVAAATTILLGKSVSGVSVALRLLRTALIATGIGALVVLAGEIINNWDAIKGVFIRVGSACKSVFSGVVGWVASKFKVVGEALTGIFSPVFDWFKVAWSAVGTVVSAVLGGVGAVIKNTASALSSIFSPVFDWLGAKFGWIGEFASAVWGRVTGNFKVVGEALTGIFSPVFDWLGAKFGWIVDKIKGIASMWGKVKEFFGFESDPTKSEPKTGEKSVIKEITAEREKVRETQIQRQNDLVTQKTATAVAPNVTVNFSGDFKVGVGANGKFELDAFQAQVVQAVKKSLMREEINARNAEVRDGF